MDAFKLTHNNSSKGIFLLLLIATITIALISMPSMSYAKSGLTIVLKLKYSKLADSHPEYYDKVRLTIGKYFNEYFNLKKMKFPSSIEVTGLKDPRRYKIRSTLE